jgi:hypothetical protein
VCAAQQKAPKYPAAWGAGKQTHQVASSPPAYLGGGAGEASGITTSTTEQQREPKYTAALIGSVVPKSTLCSLRPRTREQSAPKYTIEALLHLGSVALGGALGP